MIFYRTLLMGRIKSLLPKGSFSLKASPNGRINRSNAGLIRILKPRRSLHSKAPVIILKPDVIEILPTLLVPDNNLPAIPLQQIVALSQNIYIPLLENI